MIEYVTDFACDITRELEECLIGMRKEEAERFYEDFRKAERVFAWAPGRLQAVLRCFISRLSQTGKTAYFVGDTITPAIGYGDLLLIASGAGHNPGIASIAERAGKFGSKVVLFTIVPKSLCQSVSDYTVIIPGRTAACGGIGTSIQPGGGKYEQGLFLFLEAVLLRYYGETGKGPAVPEADMRKLASLLAEEVRMVMKKTDEQQTEALIHAVAATAKEGGKVFGWSPSVRERNLLRCYIMRLMHMEIPAFIWGDTVCPEPGRGDVFLLSDGFLENPLAKAAAREIKRTGTELFLLTAGEKMNGTKCLYIPVQENSTKYQTASFLYEQSMLILLDAMIAKHNEALGVDRGAAFCLHANLE